jgi:hypothetical protein
MKRHAFGPLNSAPKEPRQAARNFFSIFRKFILHFLNTLIEQAQVRFRIGSYFLSSQVPLGRFYSSRPSSRSRREIVSE